MSSIYQHIGLGTVNSRTERRTYTYDSKGNITHVRENGRLVLRYKYDGLNRLIREDNVKLSKSFTYEYDHNGNILYKGMFSFTLKELTDGDILSYTYNSDQLESISGEQIQEDFMGEYDALGNPWIYRNHDLTWGTLRNLDAFDDVTFKYNAAGIRTEKTKGDVNTKFYWADSRLLAEKRVKSECELEVGGTIPEGGAYIYAEEKLIEYIYGADGIAGFTFDGKKYWYLKNLQNDVIAIYDDNECVAEYKYDAFGNCEIVTNKYMIAEINPIRYRSYYFDTQTGLYYILTRYYDPQNGRFISPDLISILDTTKDYINGLNLYAYCLNNWIMMVDETGMIFGKIWKGIKKFASSTVGKIIRNVKKFVFCTIL